MADAGHQLHIAHAYPKCGAGDAAGEAETATSPSRREFRALNPGQQWNRYKQLTEALEDERGSHAETRKALKFAEVRLLA